MITVTGKCAHCLQCELYYMTGNRLDFRLYEVEVPVRARTFFTYFHIVQTGFGVTKLPIQRVPGILSTWGKAAGGVKPNAHLQLTLKKSWIYTSTLFHGVVLS
jgi:hypothetical protein